MNHYFVTYDVIQGGVTKSKGSIEAFRTNEQLLDNFTSNLRKAIAETLYRVDAGDVLLTGIFKL